MQIYLVRHARSTANAEGVLAGRSPGVLLHEDSKVQGEFLSSYFSNIDLARIVSSPLERARATAKFLKEVEIEIDERINECDYGSWTGLHLKELAKDPLWESVLNRPSHVRFPTGESFVEIQQRIVDVVEELRSCDSQSIALVSHGDPIRLLLAHYLSISLDDFQRISIAPASISVLDFSGNKVSISAMNVTMPTQHSVSNVGGGDSA